MPDVQAATDALEKSAATFLRILRDDTAGAIRDALLQLRRDMLAAGRVKSDPRFNDQYANQAYQADVVKARAKCQAQLDRVETSMSQSVDSVRALIAKSTTQQRDATAELAYQLQRQGAARRVDMLRTAGVKASEIIRRLAANGDTLALDVVREDLPFTASDSRQDQIHLEALLSQLDQATTPLLSAAQQAGRALEKEVADGVYQLKIAFTLARNEASGASSGLAISNQVSLMPAWKKGDTLRVAFTTPDGGLNPAQTNVAPGTTGYQAQPMPNYGKPNADGQ